jgi:hypothetical protein
MEANATHAMTQHALVKLLDVALFPGPRDPEGSLHGHHGPGLRGSAFRDVSLAALNPQPLPPGPPPELGRGPVPEPWLGAWLARTVIDRAVTEYQLAEVVSGAEPSERMVAAVRRHIARFVDDWWCPLPFPWPWPWPPAPPGPVELLAAGVQFHHAAERFAGLPLQADFAAAAAQLLEKGLKGALEHRSRT